MTPPDVALAAPDAEPAVRLDPMRIALFPIRAFIALGWIRAGTEKLVNSYWWTGEYLSDFVNDQRGDALPFMNPLAEVLVLPVAPLVAFAVLVLQFALGASVITGVGLRKALAAGLALNAIFVAMGAVDPSAFYLVIQLTLLAALEVRSPRPPSRRFRIIRSMLWVATMVALAPFISTLHPAEVIEDSALILITVAALGLAVDGLHLIAGDTARPGSGPVDQVAAAAHGAQSKPDWFETSSDAKDMHVECIPSGGL